MSLLYFLVQQMMLFSIPLLIVALGGMFCERSGVINIALEGIMVLGGFAGILFINLFQGVLPGQPILLIALLISMVTGMVVSLVRICLCKYEGKSEYQRYSNQYVRSGICYFCCQSNPQCAADSV